MKYAMQFREREKTHYKQLEDALQLTRRELRQAKALNLEFANYGLESRVGWPGLLPKKTNAV